MHKKLVKEAKDAISKVNSDTSVSPGTTRSSLEDIIEHAKELLSALEVCSEDEDDLDADR